MFTTIFNTICNFLEIMPWGAQETMISSFGLDTSFSEMCYEESYVHEQIYFADNLDYYDFYYSMFSNGPLAGYDMGALNCNIDVYYTIPWVSGEFSYDTFVEDTAHLNTLLHGYNVLTVRVAWYDMRLADFSLWLQYASSAFLYKVSELFWFVTVDMTLAYFGALPPNGIPYSRGITQYLNLNNLLDYLIIPWISMIPQAILAYVGWQLGCYDPFDYLLYYFSQPSSYQWDFTTRCYPITPDLFKETVVITSLDPLKARMEFREDLRLSTLVADHFFDDSILTQYEAFDGDYYNLPSKNYWTFPFEDPTQEWKQLKKEEFVFEDLFEKEYKRRQIIYHPGSFPYAYIQFSGHPFWDIWMKNWNKTLDLVREPIEKDWNIFQYMFDDFLYYFSVMAHKINDFYCLYGFKPRISYSTYRHFYTAPDIGLDKECPLEFNFYCIEHYFIFIGQCFFIFLYFFIFLCVLIFIIRNLGNLGNKKGPKSGSGGSKGSNQEKKDPWYYNILHEIIIFPGELREFYEYEIHRLFWSRKFKKMRIMLSLYTIFHFDEFYKPRKTIFKNDTLANKLYYSLARFNTKRLFILISVYFGFISRLVYFFISTLFYMVYNFIVRFFIRIFWVTNVWFLLVRLYYKFIYVFRLKLTLNFLYLFWSSLIYLQNKYLVILFIDVHFQYSISLGAFLSSTPYYTRPYIYKEIPVTVHPNMYYYFSKWLSSFYLKTLSFNYKHFSVFTFLLFYIFKIIIDIVLFLTDQIIKYDVLKLSRLIILLQVKNKIIKYILMCNYRKFFYNFLIIIVLFFSVIISQWCLLIWLLIPITIFIIYSITEFTYSICYKINNKILNAFIYFTGALIYYPFYFLGLFLTWVIKIALYVLIHAFWLIPLLILIFYTKNLYLFFDLTSFLKEYFLTSFYQFLTDIVEKPCYVERCLIHGYEGFYYEFLIDLEDFLTTNRPFMRFFRRWEYFLTSEKFELDIKYQFEKYIIFSIIKYFYYKYFWFIFYLKVNTINQGFAAFLLNDFFLAIYTFMLYVIYDLPEVISNTFIIFSGALNYIIFSKFVYNNVDYLDNYIYFMDQIYLFLHYFIILNSWFWIIIDLLNVKLILMFLPNLIYVLYDCIVLKNFIEFEFLNKLLFSLYVDIRVLLGITYKDWGNAIYTISTSFYFFDEWKDVLISYLRVDYDTVSKIIPLPRTRNYSVPYGTILYHNVQEEEASFFGAHFNYSVLSSRMTIFSNYYYLFGPRNLNTFDLISMLSIHDLKHPNYSYWDSISPYTWFKRVQFMDHLIDEEDMLKRRFPGKVDFYCDYCDVRLEWKFRAPQTFDIYTPEGTLWYDQMPRLWLLRIDYFFTLWYNWTFRKFCMRLILIVCFILFLIIRSKILPFLESDNMLYNCQYEWSLFRKDKVNHEWLNDPETIRILGEHAVHFEHSTFNNELSFPTFKTSNDNHLRIVASEVKKWYNFKEELLNILTNTYNLAKFTKFKLYSKRKILSLTKIYPICQLNHFLLIRHLESFWLYAWGWRATGLCETKDDLIYQNIINSLLKSKSKKSMPYFDFNQFITLDRFVNFYQIFWDDDFKDYFYIFLTRSVRRNKVLRNIWFKHQSSIGQWLNLHIDVNGNMIKANFELYLFFDKLNDLLKNRTSKYFLSKDITTLIFSQESKNPDECYLHESFFWNEDLLYSIIVIFFYLYAFKVLNLFQFGNNYLFVLATTSRKEWFFLSKLCIYNQFEVLADLTNILASGVGGEFYEAESPEGYVTRNMFYKTKRLRLFNAMKRKIFFMVRSGGFDPLQDYQLVPFHIMKHDAYDLRWSFYNLLKMFHNLLCTLKGSLIFFEFSSISVLKMKIFYIVVISINLICLIILSIKKNSFIKYNKTNKALNISLVSYISKIYNIKRLKYANFFKEYGTNSKT